MDRMLNRESGLKGITGKNDMREILAGAAQGDVQCTRAISAFCYRIRKYIGAYMAALGGLDVLIFHSRNRRKLGGNPRRSLPGAGTLRNSPVS